MITCPVIKNKHSISMYNSHNALKQLFVRLIAHKSYIRDGIYPPPEIISKIQSSELTRQMNGHYQLSLDQRAMSKR